VTPQYFSSSLLIAFLFLKFFFILALLRQYRSSIEEFFSKDIHLRVSFQMNYHLLMNTALSGKKQQRERENFSSRASLMQKASWQIARDKSTEFLTRKMSKLSFKQG